MSVNLLLDDQQPLIPATAWKNLKVNNLVVSGDLTLSNVTRAVLSSGYNDHTLIFSLEAIEGSLLNYAEGSDIDPVNIVYNDENINVDESGIYLINIQFVLQIQAYTAPTIFDLEFFNDSDTSICCESQIHIDHGSQFNISLNRVLHLDAGKNYAVLIRQSVVQSTSLIGSSNRSFISMYKLF